VQVQEQLAVLAVQVEAAVAVEIQVAQAATVVSLFTIKRKNKCQKHLL
jgi:hypothetical protein